MSLQVLAVEAIVEATGAVTMGVTLAVVEVAPALQGGRAVLPGVVEVQRAVAAVPSARVVVAQEVTELVAPALPALQGKARSSTVRTQGHPYSCSALYVVKGDGQ